MKSDLLNEPSILEKPYNGMSGWGMLFGALGALLLASILFMFGIDSENGILVFAGILIFLAALLSMGGLVAIQPNSARVLLLFGDYKGTLKESGFYWVNPFFSKKKISLRIRNFETGSIHTPEKKDAAGTVITQRSRTAGRPSKVNDRDGNPIDISAIVVWKVVDTAEAMFEVNDYEDFVRVQSEAALRVLATRHPYDSEDHEVSLRGCTTEIAD